jgi:hypothetical protein
MLLSVGGGGGLAMALAPPQPENVTNIATALINRRPLSRNLRICIGDLSDGLFRIK